MALSPIKALVVDANAFGRAVEPDCERLELWSTACEEHGGGLWIAEVVVWELADRVIAATEEFRSAAIQYNRKREPWGLDEVEVPDPLTVRDVFDLVEAAGARVVTTRSEAAVLGVRDQVLQTGPATRKSSVKTGAADSTWIRSVFAEASGDTSGLVFVTGDDGAVKTTCEVMGLPLPQIAPNFHALRDLLGEVVEPTDEQRTRLQAAVETLVSVKC